MIELPTPETDAVAEAVGMGHFMVDAEFTRKLERERNDARDDLAEETKFHHRTHAELVQVQCQLQDVICERDEAMQSAEAFSALAWKLEGERNEAREERDIARLEFEEISNDLTDARKERDKAREELKEIAEYGTEEINAAVELRQKLASALIERDELRSECKALWVMVDTEKKKTYTALRERDEAREALRTLAEHGESEIQRLTKERDEAREQATEQFIAAGKAREQAAKWLARLQEEGLEEYGN